MSCIKQYLPNIRNKFINLYDDYKLTINSTISDNKFNPNIILTALPYEEAKGPSFNWETKTVKIHESFLIYSWIISYFILFKYESNFQKNWLKNSQLNIDIPEVANAYNLFSFCINNKKTITEFNHQLPNPCSYKNFSNFEIDIISKANYIFTSAMIYILWHEFFHGLGMHNSAGLTDGEIRELEKEADNYARRTIFREHESEQLKVNLAMGIVSANIASMFYVSKPNKIRVKKHFDYDDRLIHSILDMNFNNQEQKNIIESVACDSIIIFLRTSIIGLELPSHFNSFKEFIELVSPFLDQIKEFEE